MSQPEIAKNSLKALIFRVQGHSRLSMLVPLESSSAVLVMIRNKSVSICNRSHARWLQSGKITISCGYPCLMPSFVVISSPSGTKFAHKKVEVLRYHAWWKPGASISAGLRSVPGCDRQDGQNYDS